MHNNSPDPRTIHSCTLFALHISYWTDPELKGGGVPLGSRRWCSGPIQQKKRPDLGLACHVEPDRPNSCCCIGQECAVPKITCDVSDRKPAPTCQEKIFFGIFFVESTRTQPEATDRHRQSPLRVHSNSPKNRRLAAGGSVHRPFSSGSVSNREIGEAAKCHKGGGGCEEAHTQRAAAARTNLRVPVVHRTCRQSAVTVVARLRRPRTCAHAGSQLYYQRTLIDYVIIVTW